MAYGLLSNEIYVLQVINKIIPCGLVDNPQPVTGHGYLFECYNSQETVFEHTFE